MSDQPAYRITDALAALDAATLNLEEVRRILSTPVPPPPPPGYTLRLGDNPEEAIADLSAGDSLRVVAGVHPHNIHLTKPINVIGEPGATLSGWRTGLAWEMVGSGPTGDRYRLRWDRAALGLRHHVVTNAAFLAAQDGPARMAAHNAATAPEMVRYNGDVLRRVSLSQLTSMREPLTQAYDDKEGLLYISLPAGADPGEVEVAMLPQLFTAADGVAGVTVEGLTLTGAANTHKQGAFELHSDGNTIRRVMVDTVNSLGFSIRGIGLTMEQVQAHNAGQMGHWLKLQASTLTNCGHHGSNWRGSDAGWHASNKWEQSIGNTVAGWYGINTDGCGLWLDVGNHDNTFMGIDLISCGKNALMVEHHATGNTFSGRIRDTRPLSRWAGSDIQIQSNVKGNAFDGIDIHGDLVPYWLVYKTAEARGPSGPNVFRDISTQGRPMLIQGGQHKDDVFESIN